MFSQFQPFPLLAFALLAYGWLRLIDHLRVIWTVDEQYAYGWAVPLLCVFLLWRRWRSPEKAKIAKVEIGKFRTVPSSEARHFSISAFQRCSVSAFLVLLAFLFTRWIEEANPDWRLIGWALALEVIGASLLLLHAAGGAKLARHFAFPILFFLVAVPWPTFVEHPIIQTLTRGIVAGTVEVLNLFGMAALAHGNVIETAGGLVDIDEACSGIRSLQAVFMLALFFGELRRFTVRRRVLLCGLGFGLACVFNLTRTVVLSWVAAKQGTAAVQRWHDPAGVAILVSCFVGVWALAAWLGRSQSSTAPTSNTLPSPPRPGRGTEGEVSNPASRPQLSTLNSQPSSSASAFALATLLVAGELAIWWWYVSTPRVAAVEWRAELPRTNPTFRPVELPSAALRILRFNEGQSGVWENGDGTRWQMIYLRWKPGRVAAQLARNHTPEVCLPAAGKSLRSVSDESHFEVAGLSLPFRCYTTDQNGRSLFVFYALWEDGAREQRVLTQSLTWRARFDAVLERRRNPGQRVLEIAISGARDLAQAETSLREELPHLIHLQPANRPLPTDL